MEKKEKKEERKNVLHEEGRLLQCECDKSVHGNQNSIVTKATGDR